MNEVGSMNKWVVRRLKFVAALTAGQSAEGSEVNDEGDGLPFLQGCAEFGPQTPLADRSCINPPKIARTGSWLISVRAPVGRINRADQTYGIGRGLAAVEAEKIDSEFLGYVLEDQAGILNSLATGSTFTAVSTPQVGSLAVSIPPPEAQKRIAAFLDRKTEKIDALIAKKRALLERLAEKRQSTIIQAVTKGLDSAAPTKKSGIEWLGQIPTHWERGNIRRFAKMKTGHTPSRSVPDYWIDCTVPWFTLSDVWQLRDGTRIYIEGTAEKISELGLANSAAELLPAGTVIFSRTASIGFSGIMPYPMATSQDFWNWICGPKLIPEYLLLLFRAMAQKFDKITSGSTHKTIYQPIAAGLEICVPPKKEQGDIVKQVLGRVRAIDHAREKVDRSIAKLKEYRSALITAAVTGQIESLR